MPEPITIKLNGKPMTVALGSTVAAAIAQNVVVCRTSVRGEARGPVCGMGICFECRVAINGTPHCRSCQILCAPGMDVRTDV